MLRSVFRISELFLLPRPWQFEIWDSTDKQATCLLLGFETLNLKFRDLKLWKLTVGRFPWSCEGSEDAASLVCRCSALLLYMRITYIYIYIEREREKCVYVYIYIHTYSIYIYIYMYVSLSLSTCMYVCIYIVCCCLYVLCVVYVIGWCCSIL